MLHILIKTLELQSLEIFSEDLDSQFYFFYEQNEQIFSFSLFWRCSL